MAQCSAHIKRLLPRRSHCHLASPLHFVGYASQPILEEHHPTMILTESTTMHLWSAVTAVLLVLMYRLPYFQRNPTIGLSVVLCLNWALPLFISMAETRMRQDRIVSRNLSETMCTILQRAELSTMVRVAALFSNQKLMQCREVFPPAPGLSFIPSTVFSTSIELL